MTEHDFVVNLPLIKDDDEIGAPSPLMTRDEHHPRPIHYHIAMIRAAKVYHQFRSALKTTSLSQLDVIDLVTRADEELAQIIIDLPPYLHADFDAASRIVADEVDFPWVSRQRINISLVLLNLRMRVNKVLQNIWSDEGAAFQRARSICLDSSNAMISLVLDGHVPLERLNTWWVHFQMR